MILIGLISREEIEEYKQIHKIAVVANRFKQLKALQLLEA